MATSGPGDVIRQQMMERGMTEEDLIEGCKQILEDYGTAQAVLTAKQGRERMRGVRDEVARQAQSGEDPRDNLMKKITRKMLGGN